MTTALILFSLGISLSAFFSGSETGFYRVSRVRLLLDGMDGDPVSRSLLWLTNHPALFVATTLIGNNVANYVTSLAIVIFTQAALEGDTLWADLLAPVAMSPIIFVYGELLPKNLFYHAPNLLLRRCGPPLLICAILFAPLSALLWAFGRVLQSIIGQAPLVVRLTLARRELQKVLEEGHEAGILRPSQRKLAQNLFAIASGGVLDLSVPVSRVATVEIGSKKSEVLRLARRHRVSVTPVRRADSPELDGYVRIVDLCLDESETVDTVRPLVRVPAAESHIEALIRMQTSKEELAVVVNDEDQMLGLLYADALTAPLFRGG